MRELAIAVLFLAGGPVSAWAQAGAASSPAAEAVDTSGEDVAVLEAPIGHRQPGMGDLPPSLRQKEESGFGRSEPPQRSEPVRQRQGKPDDPAQYEAPPTDVPPICQGCWSDARVSPARLRADALRKEMDARVKPAHDDAPAQL
jgi:hypothetical protein